MHHSSAICILRLRYAAGDWTLGVKVNAGWLANDAIRVSVLSWRGLAKDKYHYGLKTEQARQEKDCRWPGLFSKWKAEHDDKTVKGPLIINIEMMT